MYPSSNELVLTFNDPSLPNTHSERSYELVIGGGGEHDLIWLSIIDNKKDQKTRLKSVYTPRILSHEQPQMFWIQIGSNESTKSTNQKFIKFSQNLSSHTQVDSFFMGSNDRMIPQGLKYMCAIKRQ